MSTQQTANRPKNNFYDWNQVKAIPMVDVCSHFGLKLTFKGKNPWCSIRSDDDTPSTIIHVDDGPNYKANTFHDFGYHESGDNIALACKFLGLDRYNESDRSKAVTYLGDAFHLPVKEAGRNAARPLELTEREYNMIGLYGDLATKNFTFNLDTTDIDRIQAISEKYGMPMNQLKKQHTRMYERLLTTHAIPYIQEQRNHFYMDLWLTRDHVQKAEAAGDKILMAVYQKDFSDDAKRLRDLDDILFRAVHGTKLTMPKNRLYDPDVILEKIDAGELKPSFGSRSYSGMMRLAEDRQTSVKYQSLDLYSVYMYGSEELGNIPYSAFLSNGKAVVGYLEKDKEVLRPIFDRMALKDRKKTAKKNATLTEQLKDAKQRQHAMASGADNLTVKRDTEHSR